MSSDPPEVGYTGAPDEPEPGALLDAEELAALPAIQIIAQALGQLAEFIKEAADPEDNAFDDPNAKNNAIIAAMVMTGFVPNVIASDYVEAQKHLAEIMDVLFQALRVPRQNRAAFAHGMIEGIEHRKAEEAGNIFIPTGVEVQRFSKIVRAKNGKGFRQKRRKGGRE